MQLKALLEKLTCLMESNNTTEKLHGEDLERNQPLEMMQSPEENAADNSKYSDAGDEDGNRDEEDRENYDEVELEISSPLPNLNVKTECGGKMCYTKRLFDLKPEDLPCPEFSREDLMASEQPSSHHEKARVGLSGSIWFSSSAQAVRSVLAASLLPLLLVLFT
ncbi:hypothetical protein EAI_07563 [Harpegnathos saltator]|uniref:Uncharacterized protein n=2 Tax=Harpegnathos saltator TaxID=610380 RepID=E2C153_HARSA|nr:hypothetical protein EAI_07563 [Harpegnathos saltator]